MEYVRLNGRFGMVANDVFLQVFKRVEELERINGKWVKEN